MKALVISDDEAVTGAVCGVLRASGYDTVVYRWLLKALDNLEEIRPDLAVVSAGEYPRHWKTLVQFSRGIGCADGTGGGQTARAEGGMETVLYVPENFPEEERKKARALGVRGFFHSTDSAGLSEFKAILEGRFGTAAADADGAALCGGAPVNESADADGAAGAEQTAAAAEFAVVMTNPRTNSVVTGCAAPRGDGALEFRADIPEQAERLEEGGLVPFTMERDGAVSCGSAEIRKTRGAVLLEVKTAHEKAAR